MLFHVSKNLEERDETSWEQRSTAPTGKCYPAKTHLKKL